MDDKTVKRITTDDLRRVVCTHSSVPHRPEIWPDITRPGKGER